jgi:hypothetical protein
LGNSLTFKDDTETEFGLLVRSFASFMAACNEAAVSRMYGGIHFRPAVENGMVQGRQVGELVIRNLKMEP